MGAERGRRRILEDLRIEEDDLREERNSFEVSWVEGEGRPLERYVLNHSKTLLALCVPE